MQVSSTDILSLLNPSSIGAKQAKANDQDFTSHLVRAESGSIQAKTVDSVRLVSTKAPDISTSNSNDPAPISTLDPDLEVNYEIYHQALDLQSGLQDLVSSLIPQISSGPLTLLDGPYQLRKVHDVLSSFEEAFNKDFGEQTYGQLTDELESALKGLSQLRETVDGYIKNSPAPNESLEKFSKQLQAYDAKLNSFSDLVAKATRRPAFTPIGVDSLTPSHENKIPKQAAKLEGELQSISQGVVSLVQSGALSLLDIGTGLREASELLTALQRPVTSADVYERLEEAAKKVDEFRALIDERIAKNGDDTKALTQLSEKLTEFVARLQNFSESISS